MRGRKNHPYYLPFVGKFISEFLEIDESKLSEQTTKNAKDLFFT
jgi:Tat protein secretion system quality control protein TatD with DNase activity